MSDKTERIAELKRFINSLEKRGMPCEDEWAELKALMGEAASAPAVKPPVDAGKLVQEAASSELAFEVDITDKEKFEESAKYVLNREGNFKSKIVRIIEPHTDKPQRWFVCETEDEGCPEPNRGVLVGEYGRGSGIFRGILEDLGIKYRWNKESGKLGVFKFALPYYFYADWGSDEHAIGGVKISQITLQKPQQAV